ncbi:aminodeoxychorismate synthase component I [Croceivirga sp. JEA036]|uniref:aminodeoxychorismate synthase component I n=1 Tax=Croceivirga sp. JEA036 TaxID=2721162 RepID=UPI001439948C|nr:aminodeoxychorismate synthase component I [Croceivirga sp. JEA036]NJB37622.1 aminodeoxychorismate synthase component I [Croceivirga sp. JEA036]
MDRLSFEQKTKGFLCNGEPFFFIIDFEQENCIALSPKEAERQNILFNIKGFSNAPSLKTEPDSNITLDPIPLNYERYKKAFDHVLNNIHAGNSFLLNLTFPTELKRNVDLRTVFNLANAPYKLLFKDQFVCFSPECFVKIKEDHIYSYPMKGTIPAHLPNALELLLKNHKEIQEHNTIVDLIRNDLSLVAKEITVTKFRYVDKINTVTGGLYQTSSEIRGKLPLNWKDNFATLLFKLLPAGSISGAPKNKTISIIKEAEQYKRGYYTGVFGVYDGNTIDIGVAIRFIEQINDKAYFKSGGGITHQSVLDEEYDELLKKVYVPTL